MNADWFIPLSRKQLQLGQFERPLHLHTGANERPMKIRAVHLFDGEDFVFVLEMKKKQTKLLVSPLAVIRFDWPAELVFRSERRCCRPRRSLSPALGGIQEPVKCQKQKMHPNELDARAFFFSLGKRKVRRFKLPVDVHHAAKLMMKAAGSPSRCDGGHRLITFWNGSTQQLFLLLLFLNMKMDGWNRRSGPDIDVLFRFFKKKPKLRAAGPSFRFRDICTDGVDPHGTS